MLAFVASVFCRDNAHALYIALMAVTKWAAYRRVVCITSMISANVAFPYRQD